jgi:phosphohistidine phosphatase
MLVRHAKAVEEDVAGDHARALSERGRADALNLSTWIDTHASWPDMVLCSTATRTRETLAGLGVPLVTAFSDKLYLASAGDLLAQIHACDDGIRTLMVIAHNPGLHGLLALLVGEYANDADADKVMLKFPTSACAVLTFEAENWAQLAPQGAMLQKLRH